jgi:hypothetical protein
MTGNTPHPHFDDGGTLHWHTQFARALATAKTEQRMVFVELGREQ